MGFFFLIWMGFEIYDQSSLKLFKYQRFQTLSYHKGEGV